MKGIRCSLLAGLACVACNDAPVQLEADGTSGSDSGTTAAAATATDPAGSTSSASSTMGLDTGSGTGLGTGTSTGDGSSGSDSTSDTGAVEPPHETDWGLCAIDVTCDDVIVDEPKRNCFMRVAEADGYVVYEGPAGFENRGRSSQGWPKHQYGVELWQVPNVELVGPGSTWRYNDGASPGAVDWMSPGFDDSDWSEGPAPLGYGISGPEWFRWGMPWATVAQIPHATTTSYGPNASAKYITSWFRHEFEVQDASALHPVALDIRADDGAVVYINGTEAARFNMPEGPVNQATLAASSIASLAEVEFSDFPIDNSLLVDGTNVIAVELHQVAGDSADVVLDLALSTKPPDVSANFFEFGSESDWILNGMYFDLSLYRNKLVYDLFADFEPLDNIAPEPNYAPQGHYCELTLDGDWRGIYWLGEKIKRDDDRVDILPEMGTGESFIFKSDITKIWIVTNSVGWQLVYPKVENAIGATAEGLEDFMSGFAGATSGLGTIWEHVDLASVVDWVLIQEFTRNGDAYRSSMHIYKDVGGKIKFVPWDFDIGLGGACSGPEGWITRGSNHWLNAIAGTPVFQAALVARWTELRATVMSQAAIEARVAGYVATMTEEKIAENFARWPQNEIIGGDDWVLPFRLGCPVDTWEQEHELVQQWIADRLLWMDANIENFE